MAQHYIMRKGCELFGDRVDAAIMKELTQIYDFNTYVLVRASNMLWDEKKKVLEFLLVVTEKRNGDIKARKVSDKSK